ncbi:MAG: magnesium transporter MgtE N-terminal domain-containing protein, partial [Phycisphaerales bacterium JB041]
MGRQLVEKGRTVVRLLEELQPDDRAAFLDELPAQAASKLINRLSPANRRITQQILN